jgi:hypothetical protein
MRAFPIFEVKSLQNVVPDLKKYPDTHFREPYGSFLKFNNAAFNYLSNICVAGSATRSDHLIYAGNVRQFFFVDSTEQGHLRRYDHQNNVRRTLDVLQLGLQLGATVRCHNDAACADGEDNRDKADQRSHRRWNFLILRLAARNSHFGKLRYLRRRASIDNWSPSSAVAHSAFRKTKYLENVSPDVLGKTTIVPRNNSAILS